MIRKKAGLFIFGLAGIFSSISFASAQFDTKSVTQSVIQFYQNFFGPIFEAILGETSTSEFFFAKVLLLLLLVIVIYFTLQRTLIFGRQKGVMFIIALVVSVLGIRYLPETDLIKGILLPYSTLAITITTFLPFLIYFFFVHQSVSGGFGRRAAWAFYAIVFAALLVSRWDELAPTAHWIYTVGIILVAISFLFDTTVHEYFELHQLQAWGERAETRRKNSLKIRLSQLQSMPNPDMSINAEIESIKRELRI